MIFSESFAKLNQMKADYIETLKVNITKTDTIITHSIRLFERMKKYPYEEIQHRRALKSSELANQSVRQALNKLKSQCTMIIKTYDSFETRFVFRSFIAYIMMRVNFD